jgi:hypothetical protein
MALSVNGDLVQSVRPHRHGFWAQLAEVSSPLRLIDIIIFALILGIGAFQFFSSERAPDFLHEDVFYFDAARSLVEHGFYGINGYAETNMPPGVSAFLALLCLVGACGHVIALRAMAVFGTLGFLVSYELLRRQSPRIVAAAICLLLMTSRVHFELATRVIWPSAPYLFFTVSALLVARKLEKVTSLHSRIAWGALLTALVATSLMLASAAMAFLGAIVVVFCLKAFRDRRLDLARLSPFLVALVLGVAVQGMWMHRGTVAASSGVSALEWPVPGFPQSYVAQLKVKSGNNPELGTATLSDIPARIFSNASDHSNMLSRLLLRRLPQLAWMSIFVAGPLILLVVGWFSSVWPKGGNLEEWYFAGYEFIYLLWPWRLETRFFMPVAPLACLYVWRGGKTLFVLAKNKPRVLGLFWFPVGMFLAFWASLWMFGAGSPGQFSSNEGLEDEASCAIWLLSAMLAAWMIWADTAWLAPVSRLLRWFSKPLPTLRTSPLRISQSFGLFLLVCLVLLGLTIQSELARENLDPNSSANRFSPDAVAAVWLGAHTDPNAILMSRTVATVSHHAKRKVVWFPPSSNAQLLMDGIVKHKVDFIIVVKRESSYYLPSDDDSFAPLLGAYPEAFRLVDQTPDFRIFQVDRMAATPAKVTLQTAQ